MPNLNANVQNKKDETPLHIAVEKDFPLLVSALIAAGASAHLLNSAGMTPYDLANSVEVENALRGTQKSLKTSNGNISSGLFARGRESPSSSKGSSSKPQSYFLNILHAI